MVPLGEPLFPTMTALGPFHHQNHRVLTKAFDSPAEVIGEERETNEGAKEQTYVWLSPHLLQRDGITLMFFGY